MDNIQKKVNKISGDIELYDEIKSGPISKIYSCNFNNINSIIRFDLPLASKLKLDRKKEITILKKISSLNLSPHILYKNYHEGIYIWEYIPGVELSITNNQDFILQDLGEF
jgi:predicted Ser/Thr protein kinase